jgi:hypothetical protein
MSAKTVEGGGLISSQSVFGRERLSLRLTEALGLLSVTAFAGVLAYLGQRGILLVDPADGASREFVTAGFCLMAFFTAVLGVSLAVWGSDPHFVIREDRLIIIRSGPTWLARSKVAWNDLKEVYIAGGELVFKTSGKVVRAPLLVDEEERKALHAAIREHLPGECRVNLSGAREVHGGEAGPLEKP